MKPLTLTMMFLSLLLSGAIFGFFYAWVCSTMWGLDAADPRIAIAAMQAMNASVRNIVFFPAFFLTPAFLALTAVLLQHSLQRPAAIAFGGNSRSMWMTTIRPISTTPTGSAAARKLIGISSAGEVI